MKKISIPYLFFYCAFFIVIYSAVFFDKWLLIYIKPIVPLSLFMLHIMMGKKINFLYLTCMVTIAVTDIFIYLDFVKYYDIIAILITSFYVQCVVLLKAFIAREDIKLNKLISLPVIVSVILIGYLIFSITQLAMPKIINSMGSVVLIVVGLLLFSAVGFFVYVADRYEKSIYLFIAICCTLFTDALLAVNELYYYSRVFTVIINIAEISGLYFFTSFFIETKLLSKQYKEDRYF